MSSARFMAVVVASLFAAVLGSTTVLAGMVGNGDQLAVSLKEPSNAPAAVELVDPVTGARTKLIGPAREPAWSPDGRLLAYSWEARIFVWTPDNGSRWRVPRLNVDSPTWSPDGKQLAFRCNKLDSAIDEICVMRLTDRRTRRVGAVPLADWIQDLAWGPMGSRIAFSRSATSSNLIIQDIDVSTGRMRRLTRASETHSDYSPSYSPDGTQIAYARCPGSIRVMSSEGRRDRMLMRLDPDSCPTQVAWSPDGTQIALSYARGRSVWIANADGTDLRLLFDGPLIRDLAWRNLEG